MYTDEHNPPHFHARYAGKKAVFLIRTLTLKEGSLGKRADGLVLEWATQHQRELLDNWDRLQSDQTPQRIDPLTYKRGDMYDLAEITGVQVLDGFNVQLTFEDGTVKTVNLDRYITNGPIFGTLRTDPALFRAAFVENGTITWPNGADIDPDVLYLGLRPHASEEEYEAAKAALAAQVTR